MSHSNDAWDGIDRRKNKVPKPGPTAGTSDAAFLSYIVDQLEILQAKMDAMHQDHIDQSDAIEGLKSAIPKGKNGHPDYEGHHDYHYNLIESSKTWREIIQDVKKKVITGLVWGFVVFAGYAIWEAIKQEAKK